eukprot:4386231-Prymnesium_polylepis.1
MLRRLSSRANFHTGTGKSHRRFAHAGRLVECTRKAVQSQSMAKRTRWPARVAPAQKPPTPQQNTTMSSASSCVLSMGGAVSKMGWCELRE